MTDESPPPAAADAVSRLVYATRMGGLTHVIAALRNALGAEVVLMDLEGSVLAASPVKTLWHTELLQAALDDAQAVDGELLMRTIELEGAPVALLAARTREDPSRLLDTTSDLIALEIDRLLAAQLGRRELAAELIDDVLSGRLGEADAAGRLRIVGVDPARPFRVLLGWTGSDEPASRRLRMDGIFALMGDRPAPFLRVPVGRNILMVVPDDPMVERVAQNLYRQLSEHGDSAGLGVSRPHTGGSGLRAAYFEALAATETGPGVRYPGQLDFPQLLVLANSSLPLEEVAREQLRPLIEYDRDHSSELLHTLRMYLALDRDTAATCEKLFIHRNTLRYRLKHVAAQLGVDLESTAAITSLWLAFIATGESDPLASGPTEHPDPDARSSERGSTRD